MAHASPPVEVNQNDTETRVGQARVETTEYIQKLYFIYKKIKCRRGVKFKSSSWLGNTPALRHANRRDTARLVWLLLRRKKKHSIFVPAKEINRRERSALPSVADYPLTTTCPFPDLLDQVQVVTPTVPV